MIDTDLLARVIESTQTAMKRLFHAELRERKGEGRGPVPSFALICAVNPMTGLAEPAGAPLAVIVAPPKGDFDDEAKNGLATRLRMIALAGEALAYVAVMDAWITVGAAAMTAVHRGGKTAGLERVSAMVHTVERVGHPTIVEYSRYDRVGDDFVFQDSNRYPSGVGGEGRFLGVLPPAERRTPERIAKVRQLLSSATFREVGE